MDEMGRPLYGDVFGVDLQDVGTAVDEEEIDKSLWGELELEEEEKEVRGRVWKQAQVCVCTCVHTIKKYGLQLEDKHTPNLIYLPAQI